MLHKELKQQTATLHQELEKKMHVNQITDRTLSLTDYRKLLVINYLVHYHYEKLIFDALSPATAIKLDLRQRTKLSAIQADLGSQHIAPQNLINTFTISPARLPTEAFALGAMYVLEGATLGGAVIAKQLRANPNFPAKMTLAYYACYGTKLIPNWQAFLAVLEGIAEHDHPQVIRGAEYLFSEILALVTTVENLTVGKGH